jgi:hypothetical protein
VYVALHKSNVLSTRFENYGHLSELSIHVAIVRNGSELGGRGTPFSSKKEGLPPTLLYDTLISKKSPNISEK